MATLKRSACVRSRRGRKPSGSPLARGTRGYDAAETPRAMGQWLPVSIDVNQLIANASPRIRARVRDLVRNFPPFARAVSALVAFTVGRGARFQSLAVLPDGQPAYEVRKKIEDRFRAWMDRADAAGRLHFYELQALAKRQELECGEFLACFVSPRGRDRHQLALQLYEPENLSAWRVTDQAPGTDIWQGIEYDARTGEPVAYHFQTVFGWQQRLETWREPAANVLHGFQPLSPGQMRGVSPFAPAILLARDMGEYTGAEIDAAKLAAKWLGFVKSPDPALSQAVRGLGNGAGRRDDLEEVENAIVEYLNEGEDVTFAPGSQRPGDAFERFARFALRMVAITVDLPYEILSGDYAGINYSTSKASRNDAAMLLAPQIFRLEHHFSRPVYHRWLDTEALTQDYLKGYWQDPERFRRAMWIPAGMPSVDPLRDGKAAIDAVAAGLASPQMVILGQGHDPEEIVEQRASWVQLCAANGLDATTGGVSTALANNPARLGAVETLDDELAGATTVKVSLDADKDGANA